jgi:O-acetylhomoserine/O-acetylserine sulfhydrylase
MRAEFEARQKEGGSVSSLMSGGQPNQSPLGNFDMAAYLAGSDKQDGNGNGSKKK